MLPAVFGAVLRFRLDSGRGKMSMRCRCRPGADSPIREIVFGDFALEPESAAQCGEIEMEIPPGASYRLRISKRNPRSENGEEADVSLTLFGGSDCSALTRSNDPNGVVLRAPEEESESTVSRVEVGGEIELGGGGQYNGGYYEVSAKME